jgi:hypothetical protein
MLPQAMLLTDWKEIAKKIHACMAAWGSVGCLWHGCNKKIISRAMLAELYFFVALRWWLLSIM